MTCDVCRVTCDVPGHASSIEHFSRAGHSVSVQIESLSKAKKYPGKISEVTCDAVQLKSEYA